MFEVKLAEEEQRHWNEEGYLVLKQVLSKEEVNKTLQSFDKLLAEYTEKKSKFQNTETKHSILGNHGSEFFNILQAIDYTDAFDFLLDHPNTFERIVALVGPFLQVMGLDAFVRRPNTSLSDLGKFHTDGGPALQQFQPQRGMPILQLKIQFFLTDVLSENSGNFTVVPKSHLKPVNYYHKNCYVPQCNAYVEKGIMPPDAKQILVKSGDVVIHPWSLWHAVAPNRSQNIRKSVSIRYGQLWCRPYYRSIPEHVLSRVTERQRRLLGDIGEDPEPNEFYTPKDQLDLILSGAMETKSIER